MDTEFWAESLEVSDSGAYGALGGGVPIVKFSSVLFSFFFRFFMVLVVLVQ